MVGLVAGGLSCQQAFAQLLPLNLEYTQGLSFGSFVAGTGGSITISPSGGRTRMGGVVLVGQGAAYSAAQFKITGAPGSVYLITLPADGTAQVTSGSDSMALDAFVSDPSGSGILPPTGMQVLRVGARLTVGSNQAPGQYQGTFSVTVNYQ